MWAAPYFSTRHDPATAPGLFHRENFYEHYRTSRTARREPIGRSSTGTSQAQHRPMLALRNDLRLSRPGQGKLNGNFCSTRCQAWFDEGKATYEQQCEYERKLMGAALGAFVVVAGPPELEVGSKFYPGLGFSGMPMRRGSHGFYIACKHCNRELEN
jgi:hypothetical protein